MKQSWISSLALATFGLSATLVTTYFVHNATHDRDLERFTRLAERLGGDVDQHGKQFDLALRAIRGFFKASQRVEYHEFLSVTGAIDLQKQMPGVDGVIYVERVGNDPQDINAFQQELAEQGLAFASLPAVDSNTVDSSADKQPPGKGLQDGRLLVKFIQLPDNTEHIAGFEFGTDPVHIAAIERAVRTRQAQVVPRKSFMAQQEKSSQYLYMLPCFASQSGQTAAAPETLSGLLILPLDADETFRELDKVADGELAFQLFDGPDHSPEHLVTASNEVLADPDNRQLSSTLPVPLGATTWDIQVLPSTQFRCSGSLVVYMVSGAGLLCTSFIAGLVLLLSSDAARAQRIARGMTADLKRLALVAERTTSAVVITDTHSRVLWVNDAFHRITGFTLEDVIGKVPGHVLQNENTDQETVEAIRQALRSRTAFQGEILNRSKNGQEYWVSLDIQPLLDDEGTHIGFLAVENDVTERRRAAAALAEATQRTECALDGGKLAIWDWDLVKNELAFDRRWYEIVRRDQQSSSSAADFWVGLVHADDRARFNQVVEDCISGAVPVFETEFRLQVPDGGYVWLMSRGHGSMRNEQGIATRMIGTLVEITDRKNGELALRRSEALATAIFNASSDAVCLLNDGVILDCNASALPLFGFSAREEIIGKSVLEFSPEFQSDGMTTVDKLNSVLAHFYSHGRARFEWTHIKPDGTVFEVDVSLFSFEVEGAYRIYSFVRDISKRKELERQLAQAQKLESIGQLAAGVAHEINTPMQCVFSNVEYLQDSVAKIFRFADAYRHLRFEEDAPEKIQALIAQAEATCKFDRLRQDMVDAIQESASSAQRVIEIVRAMKTMAHPGTTDKVHTNLNKLIEDASIISRNCWKYVSNFETDFDPAIDSVALLPAQMSQVILNLIVNAADAIAEKLGAEPATLGTITARTRLCPDAVLIELCDTGIGMPDRVKQRVFDPFFTTKDVGKGTGQGLAIAYDVIVNQHRGKISVDSEPGVGTKFSIRLPLENANHAFVTPASRTQRRSLAQCHYELRNSLRY